MKNLIYTSDEKQQKKNFPQHRKIKLQSALNKTIQRR